MEKLYTDGTYLNNNPTWDAGDVEWKFKKISPLLNDFLNTSAHLHVCEIGCGGGGLLYKLAKLYPQHNFTGWDISPDAAKFWNYNETNISFHAGDIFKNISKNHYDIILLIDVIEHVENPHAFLAGVKEISNNCFFHVPLDLSAMSVVFDHKLLRVRRQVGHVHYFTKALFLELLCKADFTLKYASYSNSWKDSPKKTFKTNVVNIFRFITNFISPDLNARLFGGNTLFAFAENKNVQLF